jgi:hypothetical protein
MVERGVEFNTLMVVGPFLWQPPIARPLASIVKLAIDVLYFIGQKFVEGVGLTLNLHSGGIIPAFSGDDSRLTTCVRSYIECPVSIAGPVL